MLEVKICAVRARFLSRLMFFFSKIHLPIPLPGVLEDGDDLNDDLPLGDGPEPVIPYGGYLVPPWLFSAAVKNKEANQRLKRTTWTVVLDQVLHFAKGLLFSKLKTKKKERKDSYQLARLEDKWQ